MNNEIEKYLKLFREKKEEEEKYKRITALISRCSWGTKEASLKIAKGYFMMYKEYKQEFKKLKTKVRELGYYKIIKKSLRNEQVMKELEVINDKYNLTSEDMTEIMKEQKKRGEKSWNNNVK